MGQRLFGRHETQEMTDEVIHERVQAGVEWLRANYGPTWADQINTAMLDVREGDVCVLGQLYADKARQHGYFTGFGYAIGDLIHHDEQYELGFALRDPAHPETWAIWDKLQAAWITAIVAELKQEA